MLVFPSPPGTTLVKAVAGRAERRDPVPYNNSARRSQRARRWGEQKTLPHSGPPRAALGSRSPCCKLTPIGTLCTKRSLIIRSSL